jgi:hypothetical protein
VLDQRVRKSPFLALCIMASPSTASPAARPLPSLRGRVHSLDAEAGRDAGRRAAKAPGKPPRDERAAQDDACATALAGTMGLQNKRYTRGLQ